MSETDSTSGSGSIDNSGEMAPYLTDPDLFVGATIKERFEDFRVDEIPQYEPCGEGDHVYFTIEKAGVTTDAAIAKIAAAMGVKSSWFGVAAMKDARAVTTQMMSLEHVDPAKLEALDIPGIRVVSVSRHKNKLKIGHLAGNRFRIRLRDVDVSRVGDVQTLLSELEQRGVPNYYGMQRFGMRGDTWQVGRALVKGDYKEAVEVMLGRPGGDDVTDEARRLFEAGDLAASADAWPRGFGDNAKLCRVFAKTDGHYKKSLQSIPRKKLTFFVSAYQSHLFNRVLAERLQEGTFESLKAGDIAQKHGNGACFEVEDAEVDTKRATEKEISPTGPMFGKRMKQATGETGALEQGLLDEHQVTVDDFSRPGPFKCAGGRRALRFFPHNCTAEAGEDKHGPYIETQFALPSGCYATVVLREVCKGGLVSR